MEFGELHPLTPGVLDPPAPRLRNRAVLAVSLVLGGLGILAIMWTLLFADLRFPLALGASVYLVAGYELIGRREELLENG